MKIVISSNTSWNLFNFRFNLIKSLINANNEVYILSEEDAFTEKLLNIGCKIVKININSSSLSIISNIRLLFDYFFILNKLRPNLFLPFTIKPNIYGSLISKILKINTLNTITGLGNSFIDKPILEFVVSKLYKLSFSDKNIIFFHNEYDQKIFYKKKIIINQKSKVIPGSGIDLNQYKYTPTKKNLSEKIIFLFIGRLINEKGIRELIEAIKFIKMKYNNLEFRIIGDFSKNIKRGLTKSEINNLEKNNFIKYIKFQENIIDHILDSDCVILPSYREGTSRSLLESGAIGRPIITTNVPGCNNIVDNGINGIICKSKDPKSLYDSIEKFIKLNDLDKNRLSKNIRKKIEMNFDEEIVISEYNLTIKQLVKY